ncbi:LysR family transcriptional regulator [Kocuria sp. HSID16901]|uniref:LysR family transcriptional regulator n=1 Tax=Kocuria sp. HSID16901 TaxID=2419505 RepID=UPI000660F355|nr:LysR family transcriptional regulator [Kocuria sp. HSID16901]MCT1366901.1 LysR family transcriptional regulator [Rothia sp. p3-SID1597]RUQ20087.1 LysR family transcriptional regulator [Kocuria sp. HSID16901]
MYQWPDLTTLEILVAVADHGSLSAGARQIGVAQPNASRAISRLERRLGVVLLTRSTQGSVVTPKGLTIVEWARDVLAAGEKLMRGAEGLASTGMDSLVVVASQTVAEHLLPRWISQLRSVHEVHVDIRVANSETAVADIISGRAQLGFVEGPEVPKGLHHVTVTRDELVVVVPPLHEWASRTSPISRRELAETQLVTREVGSGTRTTLDRALGDQGPVRPLLELESNAAVRVAVLSGAGPTALSRLAVEDYLARDELVEVPVEGLRTERVLRAIWAGPRELARPASDLLAASRDPQSGARRTPLM